MNEDRIKKIGSMKNRQREIYDYVYNIHKENETPVCKFGHYHSHGTLTVDDLINPVFREEDYGLALQIDINNKTKRILALLEKSNDRKTKDVQ